MEVSVIVLTYNPKIEKLKYTLNSIAIQKNIEYELIISDDGSDIIEKNKIVQYIENDLELGNVLYMWNSSNKGTVNNFLDALYKATGEYVYGISPGDCLYDEYVLSDFYQFAKNNNVDFCFGRAQSYRVHNNKIELVNYCMPRNPEIFSMEHYYPTFVMTSFFGGQFVIGPEYFRKREPFIYYLSQINEIVKYMEDTSTTYLYLLDGKKLIFYDRFIVWYEAEGGISTDKNHVLAEKFRMDEERIVQFLVKKFGYNNSLVKFKWVDSGVLRYVSHPIILLYAVLNKIKMCCVGEKIEKCNLENLYLIFNYNKEK